MALKTVKLEAGSPQPDSEPQTSAQEAPAASRSGKKPNFVLPIVGLLVVAGLVWLGVNWFLTGRFEISTDNAQIRADLTRVAPKIQGYVTKVEVVENQKVKAGDLLISLEGADFQARVAQAQAALAQAEADAAQ